MTIQRLIAALLVFIGLSLGASSGALAQCNGKLSPGNVCGNPGAVEQAGQDTSLASIISRNGGVGARIKLTTPLFMYVNPAGAPATGPTPSGLQTFSTGSDSNNCLSITTPGATASHCASLISQNYDLGGISGNVIYVAHAANWRENVALPHYVGQQPGSHNNIVITGDSSSPSSLVLDPVSGDCVSGVGNYSEWGVAYFKIVCSGSSLRADYQSMITHNGMIFGSANFALQATGAGGIIEGTAQGGSTAAETWSGNVSAFENVGNNGQIIWNGVTVNVSGTPACSSACMIIGAGGTIDNSGVTFSGSATGLKFQWNYGGAFLTSTGPSGDPNTPTPGGTQGNAPTFAAIAGATYTNILTQMGNALNVFNRATDGTNANVVMTAASCPWIINTAVLTAARTWTLPLSAALPAGTRCTIGDAGGISGADTITIQRQSSDTFVGPGVSANAYVLASIYGEATLQNDGATGWYLIATNQLTTLSGLSGLGTGVATALGNNANAAGGVKTTPEQTISFQPGAQTAVSTNKSGFVKWVYASTVDNIEGSAETFTCSGNPTITLYECGTTAACNSSPTTIGSVTVTTTGTVVDGTVSSGAIAAGDYTAWAVSAGTCTVLDIAGTAQVHSN